MSIGDLLRKIRRPAAPAAAPSPVSWETQLSSPWQADHGLGVVCCNICRWYGDDFATGLHSEGALCPQCGSIARDRYLFWCFVHRNPDRGGVRVLETSPRLGREYRAAMGRWFRYLSSDYDERAHLAQIRIDLQDIELPDGSFEMILTPHVLEHVPLYEQALGEIHRVLAPGGRMYLQVPVLQGRTAPPAEPEFHDDHTPVFWRYGFDLTEVLRRHGFTTSLLCTQEWQRLVDEGATSWPTGVSGEFDVDSMFAGVIADDLTVVVGDAEAARFGFRPGYMFLTWECIRD